MKQTAAAGLVVLLLSSGASAAAISIEPPDSTVAVGDQVSLDVNVSDVSDLFAFQFDVDFTPGLLQVLSVTEGSLFSSVGVSFSPGVINNNAGTITFIADSLSGPGPGVNGPGTLAQILFRGGGAGSSTVGLSNVVLLDSNLNDIAATVTGATVTASGPPVPVVPEPATLVLLSTAMAAVCLGSRRRRRTR